MSAFVVGHDHIDALLTFAMSGRHGSASYRANGRRVYITRENATEVGRILLTENERSVYHRYPDCGPGSDNTPGTIGEDAQTYEFRAWVGALSAVSIIKGCSCFDYQACETDDYEDSLAAEIIRGIRDHALSRLPGYDEAPGWEFDRARTTAAVMADTISADDVKAARAAFAARKLTPAQKAAATRRARRLAK